MKKIFVFISIICLVACTAPEAIEKRVGFGGEDGKVGIGSQSSVDVVVGLDKAWKEYDLEAMRVFLADSAEFDMSDGKSVKGAQSFLDIIYEEVGKDTTYDWDMFYAFAVNLENDTIGGEWVNAGFNVDGTYQGEVVEKVVYNEWYYVLDGKITDFSSHKRIIND